MPCHAHAAPVDLDRISAVSILSGEHRVILQVLATLEAIASRAAAGDLPADDADAALDVLRTFADACHHGKEEDILFPALEAQVPGFGPTRVMRDEHEAGRALLRAMAAAAAGGDGSAFAAAARAYVELLRAHIAKEDDILFRIAQALLSPEQNARIVAAYRLLEHDDIGDGTHVRMLATADRLAAAYAVPRAGDDPRIMALLTAVCDCGTGATAPADPSSWRAEMEPLRGLAATVARVHGAVHPDLGTLAEVVATLADSGAGDHAAHAALGRRLRQLTDGFRPWSGACGSVHHLYRGLASVAAALPPSTSEHA